MTARRAVALAWLTACSAFSENEDGIAFLEIRMPANLYLEVGEPVQLRAVALDADEEVVDAPLVWRTPDTTVTLTPEGLVTALDSAGSARIQVAVIAADTLASNFANFTFTLTRRADSLRLAGPDSLTVATDADASEALDVRLVQVPAGTPVPGRPIRFEIVDPPPGADTTVVLGRGLVVDSILASATGGPGVAMTVRAAVGKRPPDRVVVEATAFRAGGAAIPGSGQRFVIRFLHQ